MPVSQFIRVVVEGATTDGRAVERQHIQEMADSYDPQVYGARCNLEHLRSLSPDSTFRMYGDVTAVKAEEVSDGQLKGKLALYVQVDGTDDLVSLSKARQKVYTSVEIDPDFAKSGKAYLTGLAFTDTPASLGTEILKFSAGMGESNPFAGRKTSPGCLFTEAIEIGLMFEAEKTPGAGKVFLSSVLQMLGVNRQQQAEDSGELRQALTAVAESQGGLLDQVQKFSAQQQLLNVLPADVKALQEELTQLKATLATQDNHFSQRPLTSGGKQSAEDLADC